MTRPDNVVSIEALTAGGGEAVAAENIRPDDRMRFDHLDMGTVWVAVRRVEVKPKTVWIWLDYGVHIRPRRDDVFAVKRAPTAGDDLPMGNVVSRAGGDEGDDLPVPDEYANGDAPMPGDRW